MALPAVVVSMITVTNTAAGIIGVIKRRCGASQAIVELTSKCDDIVVKIRQLLQTLEDGAEVLHNSRGISIALNLRREEFDVVLKGLEKMNQRTKRTSLIERTEKFILTQGWAKKMDAIYNDLVQVRNGIETIVSSWDVGQLVVTKVVEKIVTIDVTKKYETERDARRRGQHTRSEMNGHETVTYIHQCLTKMGTLTDRNKAALNRYGDLDKFAIPDALFRAWELCTDFGSEGGYLQLLQRSADLLHREANAVMGIFRQGGIHGVVVNYDLAMSHYRIASSRGDFSSMVRLIEHYHDKKDRRSVLKYLKRASETPANFEEWADCLRFAIDGSYESIQVVPPLLDADELESAFQQSMCHFFGVGVPKNDENALDAFPTFDSDYFSVFVLHEFGNRLLIPESGQFFFDANLERTAIRNYADFLFESNLFQHWLVFSEKCIIYSDQRRKRYRLHAASSNCVEAHLFLARHYSSEPYSNNYKMKRHLLIAAKAGHSSAQAVCRQLFGRESSVPKGVKLDEEKRTEKQGKERRKRRPKNSEEKKEAAPKKRSPRASKKADIASS